jgi:hypothetical protein
MDQLLMTHFIVKKEFEHEGAKHNRIYTLGMHPYAPWTEIEESLEEMKNELALMKEKQAEAHKAAQEQKEEAPVEAEVVS